MAAATTTTATATTATAMTVTTKPVSLFNNMATMTTRLPPSQSTQKTAATAMATATAPVLEFRCLFTHDVRRKAKRWQDGFLTYHTFNNRAIVFDEQRNRVGDTYTNRGGGGSAAIGEGDELTLQQGVLVEVGEAHGKREQDLSGVIVARDTARLDHGTPASSRARLASMQTRPRPYAAYAAADRTAAAAESSRRLGNPESTAATSPPPQLDLPAPRSLRDVLGTPGGSLGRAKLSPQSPFEQRSEARAGRQQRGQQDLTPFQISRVAEPARSRAPELDQPPRKRQRLQQTDAHTTLSLFDPASGLDRERNKPNVPIHQPPERLTPRKGANVTEPITLDSDDSPQRSSIVITPLAPRVSRPSVHENALCETTEQKPPDSSGTALQFEKEAPKEARKAKKTRKKKPPEVVANVTKVGSSYQMTQSEPLKERSVNLLRPAPNIRRKKLMYKDLLQKSTSLVQHESFVNLPAALARGSLHPSEPPEADEVKSFEVARTRDRPNRRTRLDDSDDDDDFYNAVVGEQQGNPKRHDVEMREPDLSLGHPGRPFVEQEHHINVERDVLSELENSDDMSVSEFNLTAGTAEFLAAFDDPEGPKDVGEFDSTGEAARGTASLECPGNQNNDLLEQQHEAAPPSVPESPPAPAHQPRVSDLETSMAPRKTALERMRARASGPTNKACSSVEMDFSAGWGAAAETADRSAAVQMSLNREAKQDATAEGGEDYTLPSLPQFPVHNAPFRPPLLKRATSGPESTSTTSLQRRNATKSLVDGTAKAEQKGELDAGQQGGALAKAVTTELPANEPTEYAAHGPWTREAFDLFGWRPGLPRCKSTSTVIAG